MTARPCQPLEWMRSLRGVAYPANHKTVLFALALRMRKDGGGFVSQHTLMADTGVGEKTVRRAIQCAIADRRLSRTRRGHRLNDSTAIASEYQLTQPVSTDGLDDTQPDTSAGLDGIPTGQSGNPTGQSSNPTGQLDRTKWSSNKWSSYKSSASRMRESSPFGREHQDQRQDPSQDLAGHKSKDQPPDLALLGWPSTAFDYGQVLAEWLNETGFVMDSQQFYALVAKHYGQDDDAGKQAWAGYQQARDPDLLAEAKRREAEGQS